MKLLLQIICIVSVFGLMSCSSNNISKVGNGVKVVNKICTQITDKTCSLKMLNNQEDEADNENGKNIYTIMPEHAWDGKISAW